MQSWQSPWLNSLLCKRHSDWSPFTIKGLLGKIHFASSLHRGELHALDRSMKQPMMQHFGKIFQVYKKAMRKNQASLSLM